MTDKNLEVALRIKAQVEGRKDVDSLGEKIVDLGSGAEASAPGIKALGASLDGLNDAAKVTDKSVTALDADLSALGESQGASGVKVLDGALDELGASAGAADTSLAALEAEISALGQAKSAGAQLKALDESLDELVVTSRAGGAALSALEADISALGNAQDSAQGLKALDAELDTLVQGLGTAGATARDTSGDIADAFSNLGLKSVDELRYEIKALEQSFDALKSSGTTSAEDIARAELLLQRRVAELSAEINKAQAPIIGVGRQADAAGGQLQKAFGVVGVRAANEIQAEIREIDQALTRLARDARVSGEEFDRAWASGQQRINALQAELRGASDESRRLSASTSDVTGMLKGMVAAYGGLQLAAEFLRANVATDSLSRSLTILTGDAGKSREEIEWLNRTADRLGVVALDVSKSYVSLSAATKGTRLEGQATRDVFEAVTGAMAKLGKSSADTDGALQALAQMVGKGTVSMEEMRQQLAERLPGAMQATAKAMGLTVAELTQMISSGGVLAEDLLPALARGLRDVYGTAPAEGALASWARFKNSVNETFIMLGQSGGVIAAGITLLDGLSTTVRGLAGAFELLGKISGITLGALVTFDFKHPIESIKHWRDAIVDAGDEIQARLDKANGKLGETEIAHQAVAKASALAGDAVKAAAAQAEEASKGWTSVQAAYQKTSKDAETATALAVKSADARKVESSIALGLAQALGSEAEQREAALRATDANAAALAVVATARQREADLARQYLQAQIAAAGGEANLTAEKLQAIQASKDAAAAKQVEADKAAYAAQQEQAHAAALVSSSLAVADNSARVGELRAAMEAAGLALKQNIELNSQGDVSEQELAASRTAAQQATYLYRDALNDLAAARQRDIDALHRSQQLSLAQLGSDRQIVQVQLELARARGDHRGVIEAQNKLRQIEIKMLQATAEGSRAEAKAILASVEAKRAELVATGQLTPAKQAELDQRIASAKLKSIEADKSSQLAQLQRELADELERVARAGRNAGSGIADSYNDAADASERLNESIGNRPSERRSGSGAASDASGYQSSGQVSRMVSTDAVSHEQVARDAGLRGDDVKRFAESYGDILNDKMSDFFTRYSKRSIWSAEGYRDAYAGYVKDAIKEAAAVARKGGSASKDDQSATKSYRLDLNINGTKTAINVADESSAQALMDALKRGFDVSSR